MSLPVLSGEEIVSNRNRLRDLVRGGLKNSTSVLNQKLRVLKSLNSKKDAWTTVLPSLSLSAGRTSTYADAFSGTTLERTHSASNSLDVTASWSLWDNYESVTAIRVAAVDLEVERHNLYKKRQIYVINVVKNYYRYQLQVTSLKILKSYLDQSLGALSESSLLLKAGAGTKIDVLEAEIQVNNIEREILEAEQSLRSSARNFNFLLNRGLDHPIEEEDISLETPFYQIAFESMKNKFNLNWKSKIETEHPELKSAKYTFDKTNLNLSLAQWSYFPRTTLAATHSWGLDGYVKSDAEDYEQTPLEVTTISLGLTWSLFDWGKTSRSIDSSKKDYAIEKRNLLQTKFKALADFENLLSKYDLLVKSVKTSQLILKKTKEQQERARQLYSLGRLTMLKLQQANLEYFRSRETLKSKIVEKYQTSAEIFYLLGGDFSDLVSK